MTEHTFSLRGGRRRAHNRAMSDIVFGAAGVGVLLVLLGFFTGNVGRAKWVETRGGSRLEYGTSAIGYIVSGAMLLGMGLWVVAVIYAVGLVIVRAL